MRLRSAAPLTTAAPGTSARAGVDGRGGRPVVVGHRGACGYRPEHTLASYELAARLGADFIEPDLITADGVLVARHERTTKTIDGEPVTGWFAEDFTLAELKTLRAIERIPEIRQENTIYDGRFEVATFAEVLALRARLSAELGREIGVYPETKHPTYFAGIGLPLEAPLVAALRNANLVGPDAPVFVQSFETTNLRVLDRVLDVPIVQLIAGDGAPADLVAAGDPRTYAELAEPAGLAEDLVIARDTSGAPGAPTGLVDAAHAAGLLVHPYTFRNENRFLPANLRSAGAPADFGDALGEYEAFLRAGVDGLFSDHPDTARALLMTAAR